MGPSGSGKSTLFNMIGALDKPSGGEIRIGGVSLPKLKPLELAYFRCAYIGYVFQSYNLVGHLSALDNAAMPQILLGKSRKEAEKRAAELLEFVGLQGRLTHKPLELSGGQQQRVAIARALVKTPDVLLLDEPLSNLDARLRLQTREELRRIQRKTGVTTVFVTHDQEEAMSISDEIVVMKEGVLQQIGKPQSVYDDPVNLFVAKFLGTPPINIFHGTVKAGRLLIGSDDVLAVPGAPDGEVTVGIRPEGFLLDENGPFHCRFVRVEVMGRDTSVISENDAFDGTQIRSIIRSLEVSEARKEAEDDSDISFALIPQKVHLFDVTTGERIRFGQEENA